MNLFLQVIRIIEVENWLGCMELLKLLHLCQGTRKIVSPLSCWKRLLPASKVITQDYIQLAVGLALIQENRNSIASEYFWEIFCLGNFDLSLDKFLEQDKELDGMFSEDEKYFIIYYVNWKHIPASIALYKNIEELVIQETSLVSISTVIGTLTNLKVLTIEDHCDPSCFTKLPPNLGNLRNLLELHIHQNLLTCLPDSICNLKLLEVLDASANNLEDLPSSIGNLKRLRVFDVSQNRLTTIPESILNCGKLIHARLCGNPLNSVPDLSKLPFLQSLEITQDFGIRLQFPMRCHNTM